jgi:ankyrin repeat protein
VVTLLLPRYTDVDVRDNQLETPLYRNCQSITRPKIVRLLVERGADPSAQNAAGTTSLQNLAFHGELEALKILIEAGADMNAPGFRGATALHWAVDGRRLEIVRFLLDQGADVSARDEDNRTPLDWCVAESKAASFGMTHRLKRIEALLQCNK